MCLNTLRTYVRLEATTGKLFWNTRPGVGRAVNVFNAQFAGKEAGYTHHKGYRVLEINSRQFLIHRVVYTLTNGRWPEDEVDHINGIRDDNRPENLREATKSQNQANRGVQKNNLAGIKGIHRRRSGKWRAQVKFQGRVKYLGDHENIEDAKAAYANAVNQRFGEFARTE